MIFPNTELFGHLGSAYGLLSDLFIEQTLSYGFIFMVNGLKKDYTYDYNKNPKSLFYSLEQEVFDLLALYARSKCAQRTLNL